MNTTEQKKARTKQIDALMLNAPPGVTRELVGNRLRAGCTEAEAIAPPMSRAQAGRRAARTESVRRLYGSMFKGSKPKGGSRG